jgi:hypothetical protein
LGAAGVLELRRCGQFHVMPVQGAYSLWVGNRPGANGRYYEQQVHLTAETERAGENPARIESEILYRRATGETSPLSPDRLQTYWRNKTVAAIRANPAAWLGLMARKVYYLFNNFEQYNNKTFAIQKSLAPALRPNFLGWGLTLVLCAAGVTLAKLARLPAVRPAVVVATAGFYGAGVLIFFIADRFRLPLLPLLCVGAGAWGCAPARWRPAGRGRGRLLLAVVVVMTALLTFSRGWGVYDLSPAVQDYVLRSIAAGKSGLDVEGLRWARAALARRPDHPDALARAVTSFYNAKLQGDAPEREFPDENWERQLGRVAHIPQPAAGVRLVQAVALWKTGQGAEAREILRALAAAAGPAPAGASADDALGVLLLTGLADPGDEPRAAALAGRTTSLYLLTALGRRESATARLVPETRRPTLGQFEAFVKNIFP